MSFHVVTRQLPKLVEAREALGYEEDNAVCYASFYLYLRCCGDSVRVGFQRIGGALGLKNTNCGYTQLAPSGLSLRQPPSELPLEHLRQEPATELLPLL